MNFLKEKLKKLLLWKYYWEFKNLFKWTGIEIQDFNVIWHHKDATIDVFFDVNKNWSGWNIQSNKDKVFELFTDIFVYSKKYGANINSFFCGDNKIKLQKIKNESDIFVLFSWIEKELKKMPYKYTSNIDKFLLNQKSISKRHVIVIFSDFLDLSETQVKTIKALNFKNEILLIKLNINKLQWINYDLFDIRLQNNYNIKLKYIDLL